MGGLCVRGGHNSTVHMHSCNMHVTCSYVFYTLYMYSSTCMYTYMYMYIYPNMLMHNHRVGRLYK